MSPRPSRFLFIHQNFPGQFKHLAPELARLGHDVTALSMRGELSRQPVWQGVNCITYAPQRGSTPGIHPWVVNFETQVLRGEACLRTMLSMKARGYEPDAVIAHAAWGESLFVKEVWPAARLGIYCEFFYRAQGADTGFDAEFPTADPDGEASRLRLKNLCTMLHFDMADAGLAPTHWQARTFPEPFRARITVAHDGIDTATVAPDEHAALPLDNGLVLTRGDEIVTFVNRNLEPYRGYHVFMRALPELLRRRPRAQVLLVGGDEVSYGARSPDGRSWKAVFAAEVRADIADSDWQRVHFLGKISYARFVALLQVSTVHVYWTYPFVLSWSLLEAMSAACAIVASDTAPVREAIRHDDTGRLVPFFDVGGLAEAVCALLDDRAARERLGRAARAFAQAHYDLRTTGLPKQLDWALRLTRR